MFRRLTLLVLAASCCGGTVLAQEPDAADNLRIVYFTHYNCPPIDPAAPGSSPDNPIDIAFDELWYAVSREDGEPNPDAQEYDCRWIRTSGFMTWVDYYHYRGEFHYSAGDVYVGSDQDFLIENFAPGSPVRGDLARRRMTIVGQFYSLCDAADRAQSEARQSWWLFGPCHYSHNHGLMLSGVRIEKVHDDAPQYLVGEANRAILGSLVPATASERRDVEPVVRIWASSLQKGLKAYADVYIAQHPNLDEDERRGVREGFENVDSYASHLLRRRNLARLNVKSAPVQIFRPINSDEFDEAIGCVCLESSCTDRWPLTAADAANFLGPAACIELERRNGQSWRW